MSGTRISVVLAFIAIACVAGCQKSAEVYDSSPAPGERNVAVDAPVFIKFSRKMKAETVTPDTFRVYGRYLGDDYPGEITANTEATAFTFRVGTRGDGGAGFLTGEEVTVILTDGIVGQDNIPYDGKRFTFYVTGEVPDSYLGPIRVTSTTPPPGREHVPLGTPVTVNFSRKVTKSTVTAGMKVYGGWTGLRKGAVSFPGATGDLIQTAVFVPETSFLSGETLTVYLGSGIAGQDARDTFAPYSFRFVMASAAVGGLWDARQTISGIRPRAIVGGDLRTSLPGLELGVLGEDGAAYLVTPKGWPEVVTQGFKPAGGTIAAIAFADLLDKNKALLTALGRVGGTTKIMFLKPEGFAALVEEREPFEIAGSFDSLHIADINGDAVMDILLGGGSGLALLVREGGEAALPAIPGIPGDLLGETEIEFTRATGILPSVSSAADVACADLNGDGRLDLVFRQGANLCVSLWAGDKFGAVRVLTAIDPRDAYAVAPIDGDRLPETVVTRLGGEPALDIFPGGDAGPGAAVRCALGVPALASGEARLLARDFTGAGGSQLILGASAWQWFYTVAVTKSAEGWAAEAMPAAAGGVHALCVADSQNDRQVELFAGLQDSIILCESDVVAPPVSAAQLALDPAGVIYHDAEGTVDIIVRGMSEFDFDKVKMALKYEPENLELVAVAFAPASYFTNQTATIATCLAAQGCTDRVIAVLSTTTAFNVRKEVDLLMFTFRFRRATGEPTVVSLMNGLLDASNAAVENSFHMASQDSWVPAGLPAPDVSVQGQGEYLEIACTLQPAENGLSATAAIAWSSPQGSPLPEVLVTRNGTLIHTASGEGGFTDTGVEHGANTYAVAVRADGAVVAAKTCALFFVAAPAIDACVLEGTEVVVRWHATAQTNGFFLYRDGGATPYRTFGPEVNEFRETNVTTEPAHLYGVSAVLEGVVSRTAWCNTVIGGNQVDIRLPRSFVGSVVVTDPFAVRLTWTQGQGYEQIAILRNDVEIARVGLVTTYLDTQLAPGIYTYKLRAVALGVLQPAVTASPFTVVLPLCGNLQCSLAGGFDVALRWTNPSLPYTHFAYESIVLQRTWVPVTGLPVELPARELAHDAVGYTDTVAQRSGTYKYVLRVRYQGALLPSLNPPACEVKFATEVYPLAVTTGAGLNNIALPVEARLVGAADEITFKFRYAGGGGRLTVSACVPGPGVSSLTFGDPVKADNVWYSVDVKVTGPVGPGENVRLCEFLAQTGSDFVLYGYDVEPPDNARGTVATQLAEVRVRYPGESLLALSAVDSTVKVSCRYFMVPSVDGLAVGDSFSVPILGTFDENIVGFTLAFNYDKDVLECLGETVEETETPPALFVAGGHDNTQGIAYIAWIAQLQATPPVTFTAGFHRVMAFLQFKAVGAPKPGAQEIRIAPIVLNGQTQRPMMSPANWVIGEYLELGINGDVDIAAPPDVQLVAAPAKGPLAGGNRIEITGVNFGQTMPSVRIGSRAATVLQFDDEHIFCTVPALAYTTAPSAPVAVAVTVINAVGSDTLAGAYRYMPLAVTSIEPAAGPLAGGGQVRIFGDGIAQGAQVFFGGRAAVVGSVDTSAGTSLVAVVPAGAQVGAVDVTVRLPDGQQRTLAGGYTYTAGLPSIFSIAPDSGSANGGTTVLIDGQNFVAVQRVLFGAIEALSVNVVSPTRIEAVTPPGEGIVDVVVRTAAGQAVAQYQYIGVKLALQMFQPRRGTFLGGTSVTFTGQGFESGVQVFFGGVPAASVQVRSSTEMLAVTPPGLGQVQVTASFAGQTPVTAPVVFTYEDGAAVIADMTPKTGPSTGGNTVLVTGDFFIPETMLFFGGVPATRVSFSSQMQLNVIVPAGVGQVPVAIENPGTARSTASFTYTYQTVVLQVAGIAPAAGSRFGDTIVRVTGAGFHALTQVFVDGVAVAADRVTVVSTTAIDVRTPAHAPGAVAVALKNPDSAMVPAPQTFTFEAFTAASMLPVNGTICGGAEVTVTGSSFHDGMSVTFGTTAAPDVTVLDEHRLLVLAPRAPEGTTAVTLRLTYGGITINGPQFTYTGIQFIRGDTNGDGVVNLADPQLILDFLHGIRPIAAPLDAADADDNGVINSNDARYLYTYLFGGGPPPPAPFPAAGLDPTPDALVGCGL
ncbi:MAG TPA: hypothetical protein DCM87_04130 [Planctomycetes bacterium]|nr:hypothetical protein [Planctomycetota bacterium]